MNNDNDFRSILQHMAMQQAFENAVKNLIEGNGIPAQSLAGFEARRAEHDPSIETVITDKDMLLFRIDMALDNRDEVEFGLLVKELEGVE